MGSDNHATRDRQGRKRVVLTCSCCLGEAPAYAQWWNRDRGYGLCGGCATWIREKSRSFDPDEFRRSYGDGGVHWLPAVCSTC
jgi:hypothetical protein